MALEGWLSALGSRLKQSEIANKILDWLVSHDAGEPGFQWFRGLEAAIDSLSDFPARCKLTPEGPCVAIEMRQLLYVQNPMRTAYYSPWMAELSTRFAFDRVAVSDLLCIESTETPSPLSQKET